MDAAASRDVTLGQMHEGEAGLRVPPGLVCGEECRFRALEVAPAQADAAEFGQGPPELAAQVGPKLVAGQKRLLLRLDAGAAQPEDLGAVDTAASVEAADGLSLAPALHGCRPLLGQVVLRERLQRTHELAIDKPGEERVEFAGDHGHGRFVEKPQALGDVAFEDEAACLGDPTHGGSGRIALRTDVDGAPGPLPSALEVARQQPFVVAHHRQPGVDRRLALRLPAGVPPG